MATFNGRRRPSTVNNVIDRVNTILTNVRRNFALRPSEEQSRSLLQNVEVVMRNFYRLNGELDPVIYRRTCEGIATLCNDIKVYLESFTTYASDEQNSEKESDDEEEADGAGGTSSSASSTVVTATGRQLESVGKRRINRINTNTSDAFKRRGPSRCNINGNKLCDLLSLGFTVKNIATQGLLGGTLHPNTLHNFIKANDMVSPRQQFCKKSDSELECIINDLSKRFPNSGKLKNNLLKIFKISLGWYGDSFHLSFGWWLIQPTQQFL